MTEIASRVLSFWFDEAAPDLAADGGYLMQWFVADDAFDAAIRDGFEGDVAAAARGELNELASTAEGCLALIILLDQFPRNLFRGTSQAFATDGHAKKITETAIENGFDRALGRFRRMFLYLPFEHSEDINDQVRSVELFRALGNDNTYRYALEHHYVISRFGRFPTRNAALGRQSSEEEQDFLDGFEAF
ncbi:MAG: DUF924 domain-containing protein [Rhodospirillaceae bacterium]|nr:DUF924 domain-containing protein [Rhodospirillaceae bacterium]MBT5296804.1 DUF924 domain-containing protein [Rhodospirillaceae bacterium]MBT5516133.1 DUF924 domain-containing protein [Rhodospirillaceae bacterium]MBT6086403.1 DUF924 domain-containing protein [Rhodospirillaceae bacterium]MBT6609714.1 DUF924 domain-containing protein [Rhodospirillaceae bacterium]